MTKNITIRGAAIYPHLNRPDTKFKEEGEYHTKLRIDAEPAGKLLTLLKRLQEEHAAKVQKDEMKGKKPKLADLPVQPETDDDGNETGSFIVKASMKASGKSRKTGSTFERKLPIFDAKGNPANVKIGGGSELIISATPGPWFSAKDKEVGVKLYLEGVQVLVLREGGGPSASKFGFEAQEGFEAGDNDVTEEADADADTEETGGDYQF
jgi:hypothetical protein